MMRIRAVALALTIGAVGIAGLSVSEVPVSANNPTCCTSDNDCTGEHDICCSVSGSSCSHDMTKQCVPCLEAPCKC